MAQLPRCVQHASWKHVSGVWCKVGGARGASAVSHHHRSRLSRSALHSVTHLPSLSFSKSIFGSQLSRPLDRGGLTDGVFLGAWRTALSPFLIRSLSSAEVADGYLKETLLKEAEEKSSASLTAAVEEEVEKSFLTADEEEVVSAEAALARKEVEREDLVTRIEAKELELEELRSALRLVDGKVRPENGVGVSGKVSSSSRITVSKDSTSLESEWGVHPWPVWMQFLKHLKEGNYFENEDGKPVDLDGRSNEDLGLIKRACLDFARERDDIFLSYSRKDLEVVARFGCPCTDRKVVNSGKRLRDFLAIDEISVCRPCALRSSCDRADFKASADHVVGTPEVIRLLSQYALDLAPEAQSLLEVPESVQTACKNLLKETLTLAATPRDPTLPKVERQAVTVKTEKRERESKRRPFNSDVEMKPGDWKCEECQFVNFARNRSCRECQGFRPTPEMRPGDWRCPECQFLNFSRNESCYDCKVTKPAGAGNDSFDRGSRYDRGAPEERGSSRFGSERGSSRRSETRDYDRGSSRQSETRDYDRGSDRIERRGGEQGSYGSRDTYGLSREERGLERRSRGDTPPPRGDFAPPRPKRSFEEWKPDLKRKGNREFEGDEGRDRKAALDLDSDDDFEDLEDDDDDGLSEVDDGSDEDISDVEAFDDDEFEEMRPAASSSRGKTGGRNDDKDPWWETDVPARSPRSERGRGGGRGARGGGRGGRGRGDFDRDRRSSSRESSYESPGSKTGRMSSSDRNNDMQFRRHLDFRKYTGELDRDGGDRFGGSGGRSEGRGGRGGTSGGGGRGRRGSSMGRGRGRR